jgi:hypothetical protein
VIVLTTLLTSTPDPQRGTRWACSPMLVESLARSVIHHGYELVVLHDESVTGVPMASSRWEMIERGHRNPYFARWEAIAGHLRGLDGPVWCVDATDVEMLRKPSITHDLDVVFCGSEPTTVDCRWLVDNHPYTGWVAAAFPRTALLNAGILGGHAETVRRIALAIVGQANNQDQTDMGAFNIALRDADLRVVTGDPVHTAFRADEREHPTAWWRHK